MMRDRKVLNIDRGGVIPLFVMIIPVLLMLITLAIDFGIYVDSQQQASAFVRVAVIAAAHEYYEKEDCGGSECTIQQKYDAALQRVQNLSQHHFIIGAPEKEEQITDLSGSGKARLVPGRWTYEDEDCGGDAPCFVATTVLTDQNALINAFQLSGELYSGITNTFASALVGNPVLPINVHATAAVVQRNGCFVVDISPSVIRATHNTRAGSGSADLAPGDEEVGVRVAMPSSPTPTPTPGPVPDHRDEYAYYLSANNDTSSTYHDNSWAWLQTHSDERPPEQVPSSDNTLHYVDDYRKKILWGGDEDHAYLSSASPDFNDLHPDNSGIYEVPNRLVYEVDLYRDSNYKGPEPLMSIFSSLNNAMKEFKSRSVTSDKACLIFYDHSLGWPRVVKLTDDWDYLINYTDLTDNGPYSDDPALPASDRNGADLFIQDPGFGESEYYNATGLELAVRRGLFPQYGRFTDMKIALQEALNQLENEYNNDIPTADFIVHIGDGLSNVSRDSEGTVLKGNGYSEHSASITELSTFIRTHASLSNPVPIHFIHIGDDVGPHTKEIETETGSGVCLTDEQFRKAHNIDPFSFVEGDEDPAVSYMNRSPSQPYFSSNQYIYEFAVRTQGLFGPVRPPATGCTGGNRIPCSPGSIMTEDPYCRTMEQQMIDYIQDILGENPFTIVDADADIYG